MLPKKLSLSSALLLLILLFLGTTVSGIGKFSVFRVHRIQHGTGSPLPRTKYGKLGKRLEDTTIACTSVSPKDVISVVKCILKSPSSGTCGDTNYLRKGSFCVLSLPCKPFGWTNIEFKVDSKLLVNSSVSDSHIARLEFLSCGTAESQGTMLVQFIVLLQNGTIHLIRRQSTNGVPDNISSKVMITMSSMLVKDLTREVSLRAARAKQLTASKLLADAAAKARKRIELDRIINPEKYRTKSATVRRTDQGSDSNGSGGRYTPSAATQARRTKSRGG